MKSNPILTANQRVERVTARTLVIGVDIAKEAHVAQAATCRGVVLTRRPIKFDNSQSGFEHIVRSIQKLQSEHGMDDVVVGMESTGHYFFNLANWLVDIGIEVVLVNPATTKRNKENRDNTPSKSDPKDAAVIAELVGRGFYTPYRPKDPLFQRLSTLVKARERIVRDTTRTENRIHGWLDIYFPEYASVFKDLFCPRSLATLRKIPTPTDMSHMSPQDVVVKWGDGGMSRPGGAQGLGKAIELLEASKRSVGRTVGLDEAKWELARLLKEYESYQRDQDEVEGMIEALLQELPQAEILQTILTPNLCGVILACAGDLSQLDHGNQLLRMAGMNLAEKSSGKYIGQIKLSKRGSSMLRKYLFLAVFHLLANDPVFKAMHKYNVQTKRMKKMQSMVKLVGKLARILVTMVRKNEAFSAEIAMPHSAA